ncbi:MAG: hypothetical protein GY711_15140 [bacterium]|nr:hypothetical protein [bacterium]
MSARITDREREVRALLKKQASSGMTLAAFARSVGMPAGTLSWWKRELGRREVARAPSAPPSAPIPPHPAWLAVEVVDDESRGAACVAPSGAACAPLLIRVGERLAVEVPADIDATHLTRVVAALLAC